MGLIFNSVLLIPVLYSLNAVCEYLQLSIIIQAKRGLAEQIHFESSKQHSVINLNIHQRINYLIRPSFWISSPGIAFIHYLPIDVNIFLDKIVLFIFFLVDILQFF